MSDEYLGSDLFVQDFLSSAEKPLKKAFDVLYQGLFKKLYTLAYAITGEEDPSEEIVNDAFLKLYERRERYDTIWNIRAFLYTTVRNTSLNFSRDRQVRARMLKDFQHIAEQIPELDIIELNRDIIEALYEGIELLPRECRRVCKLLFVQGLKNPEVADLLGISISTVKNQRANGLNKLKAIVSDRRLLVALFLFLIMVFYGQ